MPRHDTSFHVWLLTVESSEHDANLESVGPKLSPLMGLAPWAMKCCTAVIEG